jgi:hopanoid biosynthesis associated protein HpnK
MGSIDAARGSGQPWRSWFTNRASTTARQFTISATAPNRRLVISADDFGADVAVNDAVEIGHRQGVLTAASLMVGAPGAADAVDRARRMPDLGVGLHLVLVEGRPTLPPNQVPDLLDASGSFRSDMARAGAAMFFRPDVRRQLAREIEAQFAAFAATGLALDHVNAHKHFHLHPTIAGLILKIGRRYGLKAARLPIEPPAVLARVEAGAGGRDWIVDPWARLARRRFRAAGVAVPDQVFGLRWSGAMTTSRLLGLIGSLPDGLSEIYLHPATAARYPGSAAGYGYQDELAALLDPAVAAATKTGGLRLGDFAEFTT